HLLQAVPKVIGVPIQKALLLDEVDEHQPIQHQRRIPLPVCLGCDASYELAEFFVFLSKALVEVPGDAVAIERVAKTLRRKRQGNGFLFAKSERNVLKFL